MTLREAIRVADLDRNLGNGCFLRDDDICWMKIKLRHIPGISNRVALSILKDEAMQTLARYARGKVEQ